VVTGGNLGINFVQESREPIVHQHRRESHLP
jgi:hypothetical protein